MSNTPNLILPYLDAAQAQAQKHVTCNQDMTMLDALVQFSVFDRTLTARSPHTCWAVSSIQGGGP